jgi:hypothetical protein
MNFQLFWYGTIFTSLGLGAIISSLFRFPSFVSVGMGIGLIIVSITFADRDKKKEVIR